MVRGAPCPRFALFLRFFTRPGEPTFKVGLHFLRPLVLGDQGQHVLQSADFLCRGFRLAKAFVGIEILRSEIGRHRQPSFPARAFWDAPSGLGQDDQGIGGSDALPTGEDQERVQIEFPDVAFALDPELRHTH